MQSAMMRGSWSSALYSVKENLSYHRQNNNIKKIYVSNKGLINDRNPSGLGWSMKKGGNKMGKFTLTQCPINGFWYST